MKKYILEITVFISGAVVMILELTGSRVVAPYLGTSLFVWTSLIGIILGSLSLGYWLGGKLADQKASYKKFSLILFTAGLLIAATALSKDIILEFIENNISGLRLGSVIAATVLFAPAGIFMGMVSPYAVRLKIESVEKSGRTVGNLYAISTIGSIVGTFLAGFFLISWLGNGKLLILLAIIMILTSTLSYLKALFKTKTLIVVLLIAHYTLTFINESLAANIAGIIDIDSNYNRIKIYYSTINNQPVRMLSLNKNHSSAMYTNNDDLVFEYTKYYRLARHFTPDLQSALMIGGGAYSYPKDFLKQHPNATIDVVELDPEVTEIAKKYFKLEDDPRFTTYNEDGRTFLNRNTKKYDAIFVDAFKSYSIPHQLTTVEAVRKMSEGLSENGVVIVNIISSIEGEKSEFLRAQYATFKEIFANVHIFAVNRPEEGEVVQNLTLIATNKANDLKNNDPELDKYLQHLWAKEIPLNMPVLTDDFAPVDQYIMKLL